MPTVAMYGNSLAMTSIGASLEGRAGLTVIRAHPTSGIQSDFGCDPDVVVFDLTTAQPDGATALRRAHPHSLLIGVNVQTHHALVLSSEHSVILTSDDLVRIIEGHVSKNGWH